MQNMQICKNYLKLWGYGENIINIKAIISKIWINNITVFK